MKYTKCAVLGGRQSRSHGLKSTGYVSSSGRTATQKFLVISLKLNKINDVESPTSKHYGGIDTLL